MSEKQVQVLFVRLSPPLHREFKAKAARAGMTMQEIVENAVKEYVLEKGQEQEAQGDGQEAQE